MATGKLHTWSPRSTRKVHRWLPTNPAPPVTRTRLRSMRGLVFTGVAGWLPCCMDACFACRAPDVVAADSKTGGANGKTQQFSCNMDPQLPRRTADRGSPGAPVHLHWALCSSRHALFGCKSPEEPHRLLSDGWQSTCASLGIMFVFVISVSWCRKKLAHESLNRSARTQHVAEVRWYARSECLIKSCRLAD